MSYLKLHVCTIFVLIVAGTLAASLPGVPTQSTEDQDITRADALFRSSQFDEAASLYAQIVRKKPDSYGAAIGLGRIFVLRNSLVNAETWIRKAVALNPGEKEPNALMGEILYRQDKYFQAAPYFEAAGQNATAEKLRAFKDRVPFLIERGPEVSMLPFIQTDPLPIIELTVNGQKGTFLIDTGGLELHIMPAFAEKCGIKSLTQKQVGTFAGGRQAASSSGIADTVLLGGFAMRNVPVLLPEAPQNPFKVDGIVGTVVLYHFRFTLDYPAGRLVLQRFPSVVPREPMTESEPDGSVRVPFYLAGNHFIFARGTANGFGPYLFMVDTGMAGGGFDCPKSVIDEAKIELPEKGFQGMGGGGPITVYPFTVNLTLGKVHRDNVRGLYGALPPESEYRNGFRMGGLISHGFFRPFAVTFDFRSMTLAINQNSSTVPAQIPQSTVENEKKIDSGVKKSEGNSLEEYVGSYEVAPGIILDVTAADGVVFIQAPGQQKIGMEAVGNDTFLIRLAGAKIEFKRDVGGVITSLVLDQNGRVTRAERKK